MALYVCVAAGKGIPELFGSKKNPDNRNFGENKISGVRVVIKAVKIQCLGPYLWPIFIL
jgi:hypothetical protein